MGWSTGWDLSSPERWAAARARGRGAWVRRRLVQPLFASALAVAVLGGHYGPGGVFWGVAAALACAVLITTWLSFRVYDDAERRHEDRSGP